MPKKFLGCILLIAVALSPLNCMVAFAHAYDGQIAEWIPSIENAASLYELYDLPTVALSPDAFIQSVKNDEKYIERIWKINGNAINALHNISAKAIKRFTYTDIPIRNELCDITVIRLGTDPSFACFVFTCVHGEWNLIDVLPDVQSVEIVCGTTNSWLLAKSYAFQYTVEIESIYNLINKTYETRYISYAALPADKIDEGSIYLNGSMKADEFSIIENGESVYHCYLYIIKNTSVCSLENETITELAADTSVEIFEYDYESFSLAHMQTNRYEGIGSATIDSILRWDILLPNTPVIRE